MNEAVAINLIGLILIGLITWWFLIAKPAAHKVQGDKIAIYVRNGVYEPAMIEAPLGKLTLEFIREDDSPCSEYVVFDALDKSAQLPLHKLHDIELDLQSAGEYRFTCQMGMYQGKLLVS